MIPVTRRGFLKKGGGLALASLALIPLSDCSGTGGAGGSSLTPPLSFAKLPFHTVWQNGVCSFIDANGRLVVSLKRIGAYTVRETSSFSEPRSIDLRNSIAIDSHAYVGSGITVYRSADQSFSWTGLNGNDGTYTRDGDHALLYVARLAKSTGMKSPLNISLAPDVSQAPSAHTPMAVNKVACAIATAGLAAAAIALAATGITSAAQLGVDPVADAVFWAAYAAYTAASAAFEWDCYGR